MFFFLSKILGFLTQPLFLFFILLLVPVFVSNTKKKQKLLVASVIVFYVFGNSFIVNIANGFWEIPPTNDNNLKHHKIAVVLGGISYYDNQLKRIHFQRSSDRIFHALRLLKQGKIDKIFISGGAAYISKPYETEAIFLRDYLVEIGVPDSLLIIESKSKNTYENAVFTKEKLIEKKLFNSKEKLLLITSGYHAKRALACFKKQNMAVDIYSVDGSSGEQKIQLDELLIPNFAAFNYWNILLHEWIGYLSYWITGKV